MIAFLKVVNCIRTNKISVSRESLNNSAKWVQEIKTMIQRDNEAACVGLVQLGAAVKTNTVVKPNVDLDAYYHHETAGETDGLTLSLKDVGSARTYLDIHHAIRTSPPRRSRSPPLPPSDHSS